MSTQNITDDINLALTLFSEGLALLNRLKASSGLTDEQLVAAAGEQEQADMAQLMLDYIKDSKDANT